MYIQENVQLRNQILSTIRIASKCGQAISINEIGLILSNPKDSKNVREIIQSDSIISKSVSIENELVVMRGYEILFSERPFREIVSKRYLANARTFANQLIRQSPYWKLIAVCGSVAYKSALLSDDIDIFLITKKNRMWLCFLKALLIARVFNIKAQLIGKKINFCLSYVQDEECFLKEVQNHRTSLLARELLSIRILAGTKYYKSVLEKTSWISKVFPRLHSFRKREKLKKDKEQSKKEFLSIPYDVSNSLVFALLGTYLHLKAILRNLSYRKKQKMEDIFETRLSHCACVYSSEKYREIERIYESMQVTRE